MVEQLPLKYSPEFIELVDRGPDAVLEFVRNRVWGIQAKRDRGEATAELLRIRSASSPGV